MTQYGTIKSYDAGKGSGSITPEKGGDALMFGKSDLKAESVAPEQGQRFAYETKKVAGNSDRATNLHQQEQGDKQREQAEQQQG